MGSAALAGLCGEGTDITGTVADNGEAFLRESGKYQLALCTVGENLLCVGVDNLCDEVVLTDVHTALIFAFIGNAGAHDLGKSVDIIGFKAEFVLNSGAHVLRPGLSTEDSCLE